MHKLKKDLSWIIRIIGSGLHAIGLEETIDSAKFVQKVKFSRILQNCTESTKNCPNRNSVRVESFGTSKKLGLHVKKSEKRLTDKKLEQKRKHWRYGNHILMLSVSSLSFA